MNTDSNRHTYIFAGVMVITIAFVLSFTSESLKELKADNVKKEKMQNILFAAGINVSRDESEELYTQYIIEELSLTNNGDIDNSVSAFNINLALEIKKDINNQRFPLYVANIDDNRYYIIPLRGNGLWNAIWGYIALKEDVNTIKEDWFTNSFVDEKILNDNGDFVGVYVTKTNNDPENTDKNDNEVDAISGATITGDGVADMIKERLENYLPYFNNISNE